MPILKAEDLKTSGHTILSVLRLHHLARAQGCLSRDQTWLKRELKAIVSGTRRNNRLVGLPRSQICIDGAGTTRISRGSGRGSSVS